MYTDVIIKLVLAAFLGSVVGWEREKSRKVAGFRTHSLVAMGSALFSLISIEAFNQFLGATSYDPSRAISSIIIGIGFIGAGSIIKKGEKVEGTTTAAGLWTVAAVGVAVGVGLYYIAITATVITYIILSIVWKLEKMLQRANNT